MTTYIQHSDSIKTLPEGYKVVVNAQSKTITSPSQSEVIQIIEGLVDSQLALLGGSRNQYLDKYIVLAHIEHESSLKPRARNPLPARGLGQFIYGTQVENRIIDPYNYADAIPPLVKFINTNFNTYKYTNNRDENMTCGVMAYLAGRVKPGTKFLGRRDVVANTDPLSYAKAIEKLSRKYGGRGFTVTVGSSSR